MSSSQLSTFEEVGSRELHRRSRSHAGVLLAALGVMVFAIEVPQCFFSPSIQVPSRVLSATTTSRDTSAIAMAAAGRFDGLKIGELKSLLEKRGLPVDGDRFELVRRLNNATRPRKKKKIYGKHLYKMLKDDPEY
eukprot:TRINITY_DN8341_c0_g1_i1.p1 TRINITY_DN8341_c0_g1~~TRINITY_DN8341_c0_g1_i1.p1  ORF type:complete len:135 (-),score=30.54 TRINITY_DN8341_c0_g1_i1:23-427(-)